MCNLDVVSKKGYICWAYTMVKHKEILNDMGQSIWRWCAGNWGHHFCEEQKKFTDTACPTWGPWFVKFIRSSKLQMGLIRGKCSGVASETVKYLLVGCYVECKR